MAKNSTEIFNDKVSLIYEYNNKSPLFVHMANTEIESNNLERAIEILSQGLHQFPDYASAHLLLAKAYTLAGNYSQALISVKTGCSLIHSQKTYDYYLKEIELVKKQRALFQTTRRSAFITEENLEEENEPGFFDQNSNEEKIKSGSVFSFNENLNPEEPAFTAPPEETINENEYSGFTGDTMIVSETLAKIYVAQGEFREAIQIYEKLKKKNPEQIPYYNQKIKELESESE